MRAKLRLANYELGVRSEELDKGERGVKKRPSFVKAATKEGGVQAATGCVCRCWDVRLCLTGGFLPKTSRHCEQSLDCVAIQFLRDKRLEIRGLF